MAALVTAVGLVAAWAKFTYEEVDPQRMHIGERRVAQLTEVNNDDCWSDGCGRVRVKKDDNYVINTIQYERSNPWQGLSSCVYVFGKDKNGKRQQIPVSIGGWDTLTACKMANIGVGKNDKASNIEVGPVIAETMRADLLFRPDTATFGKSKELYDEAELPIRGRVQRGPTIALTLDADTQARAQSVVDCMTGNLTACNDAGISVARYRDRYEGAGARTIAMVQIDIASGAIDALVTAKSPCTAADEQLEHLDGCPKLPHSDLYLRAEIRKRINKISKLPEPSETLVVPVPRDLELEQVYMGSTVKPIQALALLRSGSEWFDASQRWLYRALPHSDTNGLITQIMCAPQDFRQPCRPLKEMTQAAHDLGLNRGQRRDLLLGEDITQPRGFSDLRGAVTMQQYNKTTKKLEDIPFRNFNRAKATACMQTRWKGCNDPYLNAVMSELKGAGSTRANVVDVATMYARIGQAANGVKDAPVPHLVLEKRSLDRITQSTRTTPVTVEARHAQTILDALSVTHISGTAAGSCRTIMGARCSSVKVSTKTGTPSFPQDSYTVSSRFDLCKRGRLSVDNLAGCLARPLKWAVMVTRKDGKYDKVIAVVAERNWSARSGVVDAPHERGNNISAEIGFQYLAVSR